MTKITVDRALLEQALEALEYHAVQTRSIGNTVAAIAALRNALRQSVQEPVAWMAYSPTKGNGKRVFLSRSKAYSYADDIQPLYAAPISEPTAPVGLPAGEQTGPVAVGSTTTGELK